MLELHRLLARGLFLIAVVLVGLICARADASEEKDRKDDVAFCALTFDDGPGNHTEELLDILKENQIVATFFVVGEQVMRRPQTVRRIAAEGHEVDNHSFDHPNLRHLSYSAQKAEIEKTDRALRELGIVPKYFRPPYGSYDSNTVRAAAQNGLVLVLWTEDALDWKYHSVQSLENYLEHRWRRKVGGIYLFHDLHGWTVTAMREIIAELSKRGCRFITLEEYMAQKDA